MAKRRSSGKRQVEKKVLDKEANVSMVYKFLKEGKTITWIEDFFKEHQNLKPITVKIYLMEARKLISTEAEMDVDFASLLHDSRYETIWEQDKNAYVGWIFVPEGPWDRANNMDIVRKYNDLLRSLKQRENMYGLREKDLVLALHSNITLTRNHKSESFELYLKKDFDIDKLTTEEKSELLGLLKDSYEGDLFEQKDYVVENDEKETTERKKIEDPQKSKVIKIEGVKEIKEQPKLPEPKTRRKTSSIKVTDQRPKGGKTAVQVNESLKKAMEKLIREKFKKK